MQRLEVSGAVRLQEVVRRQRVNVSRHFNRSTKNEDK